MTNDWAVPGPGAPVPQSTIARDLETLGLADGAMVIVHARQSELGWIVGGADAIVRALLSVVGPAGTIAAVISWNDIPLHLDAWPAVWQDAYERELPPFDPAFSEANYRYGRLAERMRTWPGAEHSHNPDQRIAAIGARARWLAHPHGLDDSFGDGTPFARLVEGDGLVLTLGAPLSTITLLHHAEAIADVSQRRRLTYRLPFLEQGRRVVRELHDIDTVYSTPLPYERVLGPDEDGISAMARSALAAGIGARGRVGGASSCLFHARALVGHAVTFLEERFPPDHLT